VYAVYDLGGGTFDISILRLSKGSVRGAGHQRRHGPGRRRFRSSPVLLDHREQANLSQLGPEDTRLLTVTARAAKERLSPSRQARRCRRG
jgi:molecular chaperone DnaK (HSP70)